MSAPPGQGTTLARHSKVFDSSIREANQAPEAFAAQLPEIPCAAVGPYFDIPGKAYCRQDSDYEDTS